MFPSRRNVHKSKTLSTRGINDALSTGAEMSAGVQSPDLWRFFHSSPRTWDSLELSQRARARPDTPSIRGDAWGGRFMNVWSDHRIENKRGFFQTHLRSSTKYPLLGDWVSVATDVGLEKSPPNSDKTLSSASFHEWGAGATERALARSTSRTVI